ncbi:unnamed protein product [Adineta steineri]|uniref:Uncharacterized protein n=1 Tax=Adineta steineri TaxID=433720 RepID=A0A813VAM3_9BILA|nr:unnamed protein product [Adineta steineri]
MTITDNSNTTRNVDATLTYSKALPSTSASEHWFISINESSDGKREQNFTTEDVQTTIHECILFAEDDNNTLIIDEEDAAIAVWKLDII